MKLVLHVGMAKSGSTAIQRGLQQLQDRLRAQGYLYPKGWVTAHNQSSLIVAALPPAKLPRYFLPRYEDKPDRIAPDFARWIEGIRAQVAQQQPKALLMSGQTLFELSRPQQLAQLEAVLRPLADTIEIVAYLRRPSDFYLASVQQILKADHRVRPLAAVSYRAPLEGFAAIADRLHVFKYDRALFPGGDVLRHFAERFCPELAGELPEIAANVSLSTEALSILAAYRRLHHADKPRRFTEDASLLLAALGAADRALPAGGGARLKPEVARAVDEGSVDLPWLRDAHGIVFDGVDYARIAPMPRRPRPRGIDDICTVDAPRKAEVVLYALRHLAEAAARPKPKRRRSHEGPHEGPDGGPDGGPGGERAGAGGKGGAQAEPGARRRPPGWAALPARVAAFTRRAWARVS